MSVTLNTSYGTIAGNERENCHEFLGIKFANAGRFEYAAPVDRAETPRTYDATHFSFVCPQIRMFYEHLEHPSRLFYHNEFRDGISYDYNEDCLNLNIYTPKQAANCPVILYFYGGGFNSGSTKDACFDGDSFAKRGVILVTANYRVGVLGYLTHSDIFERYGRDGNFGLDDQLTAVKWVRNHIKDFGGDPTNITLMGQSAGAISIQYLCLNESNKGLFKRAIMMSGGGRFPKFALPRPAESTREYWLKFMDIAGCKSLDELKKADLKTLFDTVEAIGKVRKDNTYNTMPVIDGYHLKAPVDELIKKPLKLDYMIGYTNNDMYAVLMAMIGNRYAKDNNAYVYYLDIDAPGPDKNGAFHSSDLWYMFGTLDKSRRPFTPHDKEVSDLLMDYVASFACNGDPNGNGRPVWKRKPGQALCLRPDSVGMGRPGKIKLLWNTLTKGDPK